MSPKQAVASLAMAGWPEQDWATMTAIGGPGAESGWNATAENPSGAQGWLQILRSAHPDLFAKYAAGAPYAWADPVTNAQMAYEVYKSQGYDAWQAYTNGAYQRNVAAAQAAVDQVQRDTAGMSADQKRRYYVQTLSPLSAPLLKLNIPSSWSLLGSAVTQPVAGAVSGAVSVADSIAGLAHDFASMNQFIAKLLLPSTWLRVGAGVLGMVALGLGVWMLAKAPQTREADS
jgi:hypothetical protein